MDHEMFTVEMGVRGAYRITRRVYETRDEAVARARRWADSNSTGHYWAVVTDAAGDKVASFNLVAS